MHHADKKTNVATFKADTLAQSVYTGIGQYIGIKDRRIKDYLKILEEYGAIARIKGSNNKVIVNRIIARKASINSVYSSYQEKLKAKLPTIPDDILRLFSYKTDSMPFCKYQPMYALLFEDMPKVTDLLFYLGHHAHPANNVATFKKPINKEIQEKLGISKPTAIKYLSTLEDNGILTRLDRHRVFIHPHVINKGGSKATWEVLSKYELMQIDMKIVDNYRLRMPA